MGSKLYYVSTRGSVQYNNKKSFSDVTIEGLAPDGGLYLPHCIPQFTKKEINDLSNLSYLNLCSKIISKFTDEFFNENDIYEMAHDAYKNFDNPDIAPLFKINDNKYILELFHGPTLAFKDFALQLLSRVFNFILERNNQFLTIVGATSGDTGSAAIDAFKNNKKVNIFILHPEGKISDFQRRQMTTVESSNVFNIAIKGNFDDCQDLVKKMLIDVDFKTKLNLASINSINWCRVLAQVIYYFYSAFRVVNNNSLVNFSVPTGNFGDAYAGYIAKKMGLPIDKIIVSTNSNDILAKFFNTGEYKISNVIPTLSPSMDIQVASNFERLLFELLDEDTNLVDIYMKKLKTNGSFKINENKLKDLNKTFVGISINDDLTLKAMKNIYDKFGIIIDPHTAVGLEAANNIDNELVGPVIVLATAHAAKFSLAVDKAIGNNADFTSIYKNIFNYEEKYKVLDNNIELLKNYILKA